MVLISPAFVIVLTRTAYLIPIECRGGELELLSFQLANKHTVILAEYVVEVHLGAKSAFTVHIMGIKQLLVL